MKNKGTHFLVQGAAIAAVYVVLTLVFAPLSFGEVQIRFSEALTVLPFFTPAAIPGLFVGCIIANLLGGAIPVDIIFGSIATLIGAFFTYKLRNTSRWTAPVPPIVSNIVIVPLVLRYGYGINLPIPFMMLTVGAGEFISAGVIGMILLGALSKYKNVLFHKKAARIDKTNTTTLRFLREVDEQTGVTTKIEKRRKGLFGNEKNENDNI